MTDQAITTVSNPSNRAWWKSATVYQIYPPSFCDHDVSGHGTLLGILSKIPYLHSLGVDIVWLSPIFESPQKDMGYDISNYRDIDKRYGTLQDWEQVLDAVHSRGMKLVMDLVVNHSSDQHAWFKESRSSKDSAKRDWYIWRPAKYNEKGERVPPNNWKPCFGEESAWEYDEGTGEYYLHTFLKEQPDLNWENATLRHEIYDMMHWWLKKGVDGFRMDVINFISKAPGLPDAPIIKPGRRYQPFGNLSINRPQVHEWMKEMNREVLSHYDCFAVGETPGSEPVSHYAPYSVPANKELQMIFQFHHQAFDRAGGVICFEHNPEWKLSDLKKIHSDWQVGVEKAGGWNSNYLENHDQARMISRLASDHVDDRTKSGKLISMLHCSLGGTIFVYQGEEIGMINVPRSWGEEEYIDIETIQYLEGERAYRSRESGKAADKVDVSDAMGWLRITARDNGRTPMQWDASEHAGFSKGKPWMRVHDDYAEGWNVAAQMKDETSVWTFWRDMLKLRKTYEALIYGIFIPLDEANERIYAFVRHDPTNDQRILAVLNFAPGKDGRGEDVAWDPKAFGVGLENAELLVSNSSSGGGKGEDGGRGAGGKMTLGPWEGRVYLLR